MRELWFACLNTKFLYHKTHLWTFWFMRALLQVPSTNVAQLWYFLYSSSSQFKNLYFAISYYSLLSYLPVACWNTKIRYHTSHLWTFWFIDALLQVPCSIYFFYSSPFKFQNLYFAIPLASIRVLEHKIPMSEEPPMNVFIHAHVLVCAFMNSGTTLVFSS